MIELLPLVTFADEAVLLGYYLNKKYQEGKMEWNNKEVKDFFKACNADGGMPRFRLDKDDKKVRVYCYGGKNKEKGAETKKFSKIPQPVIKILNDSDKRNWKQIKEHIQIEKI